MTEKMYKLPSISIRFVDCLPAIKTEIIKMRTPIARGLIESIAAVTTTVPNVGKYASTAMRHLSYMALGICNAIGFTYFISALFFNVELQNDTVAWRNIGVGCWHILREISKLCLGIVKSRAF